MKRGLDIVFCAGFSYKCAKAGAYRIRGQRQLRTNFTHGDSWSVARPELVQMIAHATVRHASGSINRCKVQL